MEGTWTKVIGYNTSLLYLIVLHSLHACVFSSAVQESFLQEGKPRSSQAFVNSVVLLRA